MKEITQYQADDGSVWSTSAEAIFVDELIREVDAAMAPLYPIPETRYGSFEGYYQQDLEVVAKCRAALYRIADRDEILKYYFNIERDKGKTEAEILEIPPSWWNRILDGSHKPLSSALYRLCRIDDTGREWEQQFFAMNPEQGRRSASICLNPAGGVTA